VGAASVICTKFKKGHRKVHTLSHCYEPEGGNKLTMLASATGRRMEMKWQKGRSGGSNSTVKGGGGGYASVRNPKAIKE